MIGKLMLYEISDMKYYIKKELTKRLGLSDYASVAVWLNVRWFKNLELWLKKSHINKVSDDIKEFPLRSTRKDTEFLVESNQNLTLRYALVKTTSTSSSNPFNFVTWQIFLEPTPREWSKEKYSNRVLRDQKPLNKNTRPSIPTLIYSPYIILQ